MGSFRRTKRYSLSLMLLTVVSVQAQAAEWCEFAPGMFSVVSHGSVSSKVWLRGKFVGQVADLWVPIKDANYGESSVAIALSAQLAEKGVAVYLDEANDTCANYVSWTGVIRHVKVVN